MRELWDRSKSTKQGYYGIDSSQQNKGIRESIQVINTRELWDRFNNSMDEDYLLGKRRSINTVSVFIYGRQHYETFQYFHDNIGKIFKENNLPRPRNGHKDQSNSPLEITHELQYDKEQQRLVQKRETSINNDQRVV